MNHYAINIPFLNLSQKINHSQMEHSKKEMKRPVERNPCTDILSDIDYLAHMIPHHQVAIDMSNMLIKNTKNPFSPNTFIKIEHKKGPNIAPIPKIN